jgi:hypothetical protein
LGYKTIKFYLSGKKDCYKILFNKISGNTEKNFITKADAINYLSNFAVMKIKYGNIIIDARGSSGDVVHSRNRYGPYTRRKTKKKFKKTKGRIRTYELLGDLALEWGKLSDEQIEQWNRAAKMRGIKSIYKKQNIKTGRGLFISLNRRKQEIGEKISYDIPNITKPQELNDFWIEERIIKGKRDLVLYFEPAIDNKTKVMISATMPLTKGKGYTDRSWFKEIGYIDSSFKPGDSILELYLRKYKRISQDAYKIHFKVKEVDRACGLSHSPKEFRLYLDEGKV